MLITIQMCDIYDPTTSIGANLFIGMEVVTQSAIIGRELNR